jgi:Circadian oscillating protein COP23
MNAKLAIGIVTFTSLLIPTGFQTAPTLAQTERVAFYCGRTQDGNLYPATMIGVSGREKEPWTIMAWRKKLGNLPPQKRCEIVSRRFQMAWDRGNFNQLASGIDRKSGQGIICAMKDRHSLCDSNQMLFTLDNHQDAREVVQRLYDSMRKTGNPQYQSSAGDSIDMKELINSISKSTMTQSPVEKTFPSLRSW